VSGQVLAGLTHSACTGPEGRDPREWHQRICFSRTSGTGSALRQALLTLYGCLHSGPPAFHKESVQSSLPSTN